MLPAYNYTYVAYFIHMIYICCILAAYDISTYVAYLLHNHMLYICYVLAAYADVDTAAYHDGGRDEGPEEKPHHGPLR